MTISTVKCVSDHVEDLADGLSVAPGEIAYEVDTTEPHNTRLLDEGRIIRVNEADVPDPPKLEGRALNQRAQELDIEGRSDMSADQLRDAIAEKEKEGDDQ